MIAPELRDIPGYEGLYAVTRDGRVWAHARTWSAGKNDAIPCSHPGKWMRTFPDRRGYVRVNLKRDGSARSVHVHRLVALAWIPNPLNLPQVNHLNGTKPDNRAENLEWCTAQQNARHAHVNGLVNLDTEVFRASVRRNVEAAHAATRKLTPEQAADARRRVAAGERKTAVAASLGIARATLRALLKGNTYA